MWHIFRLERVHNLKKMNFNQKISTSGISQQLSSINSYQGSLGLVLWKCAMNSMSVCLSPVSWGCIWWNVRRSEILTFSTIRWLMIFMPRLTYAPCLLLRLIAETCRLDFKYRQNCSRPWCCLQLLSASPRYTCDLLIITSSLIDLRNPKTVIKPGGQ